MKAPIFAAVAVAAAALSPAYASSAQDQVEICASALSEQGLASATDYRAKFKRSRGGAVKTVSIELVPVSGGDSINAECKIKRGEVIEAVTL